MATKKTRRTFSAEYKTDVVRLCRAGDRSLGQVARDLGITETSVRAWVQQAAADEGTGPAGALTTAEKQELTQLRRECRVLREEREILRKAAAFFAKESR
jgi:transposase-like protein